LPLNRDDAQYFYSAERLLHGEIPCHAASST
jgi:hypothetical protein